MFSIWVCRSGWTPNGPPEDWNEDVIGPVATGICYGECSCSLTLARMLDVSLLVLNINILLHFLVVAGVCDDDIASCHCNGTYGWTSPYVGSGPYRYSSTGPLPAVSSLDSAIICMLTGTSVDQQMHVDVYRIDGVGRYPPPRNARPMGLHCQPNKVCS